MAIDEFLGWLGCRILTPVLEPESAFVVDRPERLVAWVSRVEPTLDDLDAFPCCRAAVVAVAASA